MIRSLCGRISSRTGPAAGLPKLFKKDGLRGGHVIMLGLGNEAAAREALAAFPGGLQIGGGIDLANATGFLEAGASHVIVTSWIFPGGRLDRERLRQLATAIGKNRLVLDLSCRRKDGRYFRRHGPLAEVHGIGDWAGKLVGVGGIVRRVSGACGRC